MLEYYIINNYTVNGKNTKPLCPKINTNALCAYFPKLVQNGQLQIIDNVIFMSPQVYEKYMRHLELGAWQGEIANQSVEKKFKSTKLKKVLRNPRIFVFVEKRLGARALKVYEFITYGLLEYGAMYYVKRVFKKL